MKINIEEIEGVKACEKCGGIFLIDKMEYTCACCELEGFIACQKQYSWSRYHNETAGEHLKVTCTHCSK